MSDVAWAQSENGDPSTEPWLLPADLVVQGQQTDGLAGLTSAEAALRLHRVGANRLDAAQPIPAWRKLLAQFADPLVYLLGAAVLISLVTWIVDGADGVPYDALVIALILVANAVLGFVQEFRAEHAVDALRRLVAATATVMRDGATTRIPAAEVVPGDVLLLAEGDAVAADARLLEASSLTIAEASLTGESEPVVKDTAPLASAAALGDRRNMVFGGTAVTRGRGRAVVTSTAMSTEMGRIASLLGTTAKQRTPLQREIDRLGRQLGLAVVVIAVVVVGVILLKSEVHSTADVVAVLLVGVSLAVAAVPEGLPAVLSVVLAVGVQRMARQHAIVKKLSSVETLGSASVICSDKTGTLTRNEMTLRTVITRSGTVHIGAAGLRAADGTRVSAADGDANMTDEVRLVLCGGSLANDATISVDNGVQVGQGDASDVAFLVAEQSAGFDTDRLARFTRVGEVPFSSDRKLMSTVQTDALHDGHLWVVTKGAPDVLLAHCTHEQVGDQSALLSPERRHAIKAATDKLADEAMRALAVAYRLLPDVTPPIDESLEQEMTFAGLVGILDPPRAEAEAAIVEAHRAGIRVVMITGDHPRTASSIATEMGIVGVGARTVSGAEIDAADDATFGEIVRDVSIYARVAPIHKLRIVDALQAGGNVVAMTGDGVNDAPALKRADIGIAMGVTGTDVTKEAADMILVDDNFATIIVAVREGRAIFVNIRTFLRYLLSSNVGEVLTMLLGVLGAGLLGLDAVSGAVATPLLATQLLWINLLTDTGPALALGMDPAPDDVMADPPRQPTDRVVDRQMQVGVLYVGTVMAIVTLLTLDIALPGGLVDGSGGLTKARTMAFTTLVVAQLFNCFNARSDRASAFRRAVTNRLLWAAIVLSALLQVAVVHVEFLNEAFDTTPLGADDWVLCITMASAVLWAVEGRKLVVRALRRRASQR